MAAKWYAWSNLQGGGKVEDVQTPTGAIKHVVVERNIIPLGSEVSKAKLKLSDEEWDGLIAGGSVRNYPVPAEADEYTSPTQAVVRRISSGGEIDQNVLLELALSNPPAENPPADEGAELPVGA